MNKTISINIAGFVFNIEEGAYDKLNHYLDAIKNNFINEDDCNEIMEDIEARIAELFQEKLSNRKEVIVDADVEGVIIIMGKPEDYLSEDDPIHEEKETKTDSPSQENTSNDQTWRARSHGKKRLYRDENEGVVGGVCSGLGYYVGIDPVLIRIAFVVMTLLGGSGVLLYVVLWIVMPQAKTTAEILEMKGHPVNLDSIKDHVKDVKNTLVDNTKGARKNIKNAVDKGVRAGSKLGYVLSKIIGVGFVIWSIVALLVLFVVLFGNSGLLPLADTEHAINLSTLLGVVYPDGRITFTFICLVLVTLIPVISILLVGVKLLLGVKTKFRKASVVVGIIWILSACSLALMTVEVVMTFREDVELDADVAINGSEDVLYIDVMDDDMFSNYIELNDVFNPLELIKVNEDNVYLGFPNLEITPTYDSSDFAIIVHKESHGFSNKDAVHKAENITYDIEVIDNKLMLSPYFFFDATDKYRGQFVTIEVFLPYGKELKLGKNIDRVRVDVENNYYRYSSSYAGSTWKIDEYDELRCMGCENHKGNHQYNHIDNSIDESIDEMTDDIDDAVENIDDTIEELDVVIDNAID